MSARDVNPYAISTTNFNKAMFPWDQLLEREPGIAEQILRRSSTRCEPYHLTSKRYWPEALRPPQLPPNFANSHYLDMTEFLRIEKVMSHVVSDHVEEIVSHHMVTHHERDRTTVLLTTPA
jgi:hypothetical protein